MRPKFLGRLRDTRPCRPLAGGIVSPCQDSNSDNRKRRVIATSVDGPVIMPGTARSESPRAQVKCKLSTEQDPRRSSPRPLASPSLHPKTSSSPRSQKIKLVRFRRSGSKMREATPCVPVLRSKVSQHMGLLTVGLTSQSLVAVYSKKLPVAKLHKREFKPADKTPRNYDSYPFTLDGRTDLELTFKDRTMRTPIYIKLDAEDQLLLSEGVCRQLEITAYHPTGSLARERYKRGWANYRKISARD